MEAGGTVSGYGTIDSAIIKANGANLAIKPGSYTLSSGVTATINGQTVKAETAVSVTPETLAWDRGGKELDNSYDFKLSVDPKTLEKVTMDGKTLSEGTDYNRTDDEMCIRDRAMSRAVMTSAR